MISSVRDAHAVRAARRAARLRDREPARPRGGKINAIELHLELRFLDIGELIQVLESLRYSIAVGNRPSFVGSWEGQLSRRARLSRAYGCRSRFYDRLSADFSAITHRCW